MALYQSIKFTAVGLDGLIKTTFELGFEGKQDHCEIKEFLYKIRDVRGRIMATQVVSKY